MLRNRIKEVLDGGGAALGTWVSMNSPENCEVAAAAGFDFVIIDAEHGNFGIEGAVDLIRAIEAGGATPVIRVLDSCWTTIPSSAGCSCTGRGAGAVTGEAAVDREKLAMEPPIRVAVIGIWIRGSAAALGSQSDSSGNWVSAYVGASITKSESQPAAYRAPAFGERAPR